MLDLMLAPNDERTIIEINKNNFKSQSIHKNKPTKKALWMDTKIKTNLFGVNTSSS